MTVDKNRAEVVAKARAALGDDGFAGELRVRGTGEVRGVPVSWVRTIHAGGELRETVEGALGHALGYDGQRGWRVDPSGMPGPLELGDLEELVVASAVWSGRWTRPDSGVILEEVGEGANAAGGGGVALGLRAGEHGARRFRLTLDGRTLLPRRLEQVGRDDTALELDDFRPGGFGRLPFVIRSRQAWLVDTLRVLTVERAGERSSYALDVRAPDDVDFAAAAPPAWRRTRGKVPLVRARIDDRDVGWFALDTGAGALALTEEVAAKLTLPELGRSLVRTSDGVAGAPYRTARTLQVGGATLRDPRFLELDLAAFSAAAGVKLAGILGYDLFMRAVVTIDVEAGIAIAPEVPAGGDGDSDGDGSSDGDGDGNGDGDGDGDRGGGDVGRWLALQFEDGCPVVPARFPGPAGEQAGLFALDTGSAAAVTFVAGAAPLVEMRRRGRVSVRGTSGTAAARAGELAWLELAGHRLEEVAALVSRSGPGAGGDPTPAPAVLGSLGMAVLRDFELTLDYPRRRIRLKRRKRATLRARPR